LCASNAKDSLKSEIETEPHVPLPVKSFKYPTEECFFDMNKYHNGC